MPTPADATRRERLLVWLLGVVAIGALVGPALVRGDTYAATDLAGVQAPWRETPVVPHGPVGNVIQWDQAIQLPFPLALRQDLRAGEPTLWRPEVAGGVPVLALHDRSFSPAFWAAPLVPAPLVATVGAIALLGAAYLGTYLLSRRLGASPVAAGAAAVAYTLSGASIAVLLRIHEAHLFPLLLWATHGAVTAPRRARWLVGAAATTVAIWLGGFPGMSLYATVAAGLWVAGVGLVHAGWDWRRLAERLLPAGLGVVSGLMVAAVLILPTVAFLEETAGRDRSYGATSRVGLVHLATAVTARFFGRFQDGTFWWTQEARDLWQGTTSGNSYQALSTLGAVVLLVLAVALARGWRLPRRAWPAAGLTLGGLLVAYVGGPLTWLLQRLPAVAETDPSRFRFGFALGMALVFGAGLDHLLGRARGTGTAGRIAVWLGAGTALLAVALGFGRGVLAARQAAHLKEVAAALAVPALAAAAAAVVLLVRRQIGPLPAGSLVAAALLGELLWGAWGYTPASPAEDLYPSTAGIERLATATAEGTGSRVAAVTFEPLTTHAAVLHGVIDARAQWPAAREFQELWEEFSPLTADVSDGEAVLYTRSSLEELTSPAAQRVLDAMAVGEVVVPLDRPQPDHVPQAPQTVPVPARLEPGVPLTLPLAPPDEGLRSLTVGVLPTACHDGWLAAVVDGETVARRRLSDTTAEGLTLWLPDLPATTTEIGLATTHCPVDFTRPTVTTGAPGDLGWQIVATDGWVHYRRPTARPRIEITAGVAVAAAGGGPAVIADRPADGPVFLSGPLASRPGDATVLDVDDAGHRLTIDVDTDTPQVLVVRDALVDGWTATVDGAPTEIVRADHAFRAVAVPPGAHRVTFTYRPPGLAAGALVALAGVVLLGAAAAAVSRRDASTTLRAPSDSSSDGPPWT